MGQTLLNIGIEISRFWFVLAALFILIRVVDNSLSEFSFRRRMRSSGPGHTFGELTIDTASHTVRVSGEEVALTPKEFDLLVFLASNKGIALSREKILQKVWNYDYFGEDRTVDTHVKMLRGHLGKCRGYIATVWGIGYKFDPDAAR